MKEITICDWRFNFEKMLAVSSIIRPKYRCSTRELIDIDNNIFINISSKAGQHLYRDFFYNVSLRERDNNNSILNQAYHDYLFEKEVLCG